MGINAVKAVEIGAGTRAAAQRGSEHRDELTPQGFASNHAGGVLGGISSGQDIIAHLTLKPTSSIQVPGRTIDVAGQPVEIVTTGRHDPCVGLRATPIAEAMLAIVLMDHYLRHRAQNADVRSTTPDIAPIRRRCDASAPTCRCAQSEKCDTVYVVRIREDPAIEGDLTYGSRFAAFSHSVLRSLWLSAQLSYIAAPIGWDCQDAAIHLFLQVYSTH